MPPNGTNPDDANEVDLPSCIAANMDSRESAGMSSRSPHEIISVVSLFAHGILTRRETARARGYRAELGPFRRSWAWWKFNVRRPLCSFSFRRLVGPENRRAADELALRTRQTARKGEPRRTVGPPSQSDDTHQPGPPSGPGRRSELRVQGPGVRQSTEEARATRC